MSEQILFTSSPSVSSTRIIYTPSSFARTSLIHLQETGTLEALNPHKSERSGLSSCLFFTVLSGTGELIYDGKEYKLHLGDCVFIDCKKAYSHETGNSPINTLGNRNDTAESSCEEDVAGKAANLWSLQWVHFYGPNMKAIYRKYQERGGRPVFRTKQLSSYHTILSDLYAIASSDDYVRDMRIHAKLSDLLILLMEDAWNTEVVSTTDAPSAVDIQIVKEYLDNNFTQKITLDDLASQFFINKYYLMTLFKERYGVTVNAYLNQARVTYIKQQLRFTDKTVEVISGELGIEPTYLSRLFKKLECITPSEYKRLWQGKDNQS